MLFEIFTYTEKKKEYFQDYKNIILMSLNQCKYVNHGNSPANAAITMHEKITKRQ